MNLAGIGDVRASQHLDRSRVRAAQPYVLSRSARPDSVTVIEPTVVVRYRGRRVIKKLAVTSGVAYIGAWVIGLVVASGGPKPDDPAAKVASYFAHHEHKAMVGHLLIDGLAGIALIGIAFVIRDFLRSRDDRMASVGFCAALAAAATSLVQFVIGMSFTYDAAHAGSAETVRDLFVALNDADTVKIVFLAAMIAAVSLAAHRTGALPRWFAIYGFATSPLLALSGFAFRFNNGALLTMLELTLLLLLVWVGIFTVEVSRASSDEAPQTVPAVGQRA